MIAADLKTLVLLTPKLEIVPVDPNYTDWDCCSASSYYSSSSGFRSNENGEDLFDDDLISANACIDSLPKVEKIPNDSKDFSKIHLPIDTYRNVVNWLDSTSSVPLFPKPIKVNPQNEYGLSIPKFEHKQYEMKNKSNQTVKVESHFEENAKLLNSKENQFNEKSNAENVIENGLDQRLITKSTNNANNILFEKNHINDTNQLKNSTKQVKKKLNLEEYLRRRPDLKLNQSKINDVKKETTDGIEDLNKSRSNENSTIKCNENQYEEIIIVSIGSNTDITIPSATNDDHTHENHQSMKLISKITDTIAKVSNDGEQISSNSLIASICDVIIKKSNTLSNCNNVTENSENTEHGEDKTIMHLKKDRVRAQCKAISTQTDSDIRFPTLELFEKSKNKSYRRSRSSSSESSNSSNERKKRKRSDSPAGLVRSNYGRNSFKQNDKMYKWNRAENDERCTIYVGRLEKNTSNKVLKKKFERYGVIKEVSTHLKENGMKFGFVTFKCAKDAYNTIDKSAADAAINVYDISFGGRRAFCRESYLDLDNINTYPTNYMPANGTQNESFEDLLRKVKQEIESSQKRVK